MVIGKKTGASVFLNNVLKMSGIRGLALRGCVTAWFTTCWLCWCVHGKEEGRRSVCTDHPQEENHCVYFKHSNSLKYLPAPLLSPCSWCTHYRWKWCSNTEEREVDGWVEEKKTDREREDRERKGEKEKGKENLGGICLPQLLPLGLLPPSSSSSSFSPLSL